VRAVARQLSRFVELSRFAQDVLGVTDGAPGDSRATPTRCSAFRATPNDAQIKKAFRSSRASCTPTSTPTTPQAEEKFKEAAEAYEILSDPERRATYDRYGHEGLRSGGYQPNFDQFGSLSDLFEAFFGAGAGGHLRRRCAPRSRAGGDVGVELELDLVAGGRRRRPSRSAYEAVDRCEHCHGNGAEPGTPIETCERCGGSGQLQAVTRTPFGQVVRTVVCDTCGGDGRVAKQPCATFAAVAGASSASGRSPSRSRPASPTASACGLAAAVTSVKRARRPGTSTCSCTCARTSASCARATTSSRSLDVRPACRARSDLEVPTLDGDAESTIAPGTQPGEGSCCAARACHAYAATGAAT
jgi:molecular chaperone DnaJ